MHSNGWRVCSVIKKLCADAVYWRRPGHAQGMTICRKVTEPVEEMKECPMGKDKPRSTQRGGNR
jgi:hypothetical protein